MKILLYLCTIYCVQCNLLLSQVHAEIVEGGSHNLNTTTTTTTTTTTEIPLIESDSELEVVTTKEFSAETVDDQNPVSEEQISDDESQTPVELKSDSDDTVKESPVDLTLTPDIQQEASELQETATENIESDAPETPDGDDYSVPNDNTEEIAGVTENPVEQKIGAEIPDETKTKGAENVDEKLKMLSEPEIPVETETKTVPEQIPEIKAETVAEPEIKAETVAEPEIKAETVAEPEIKVETIAESEIKTETVAESEIKTETVAGPETKAETIAEQETSSDDKLETTSEPETSGEEKSDSSEKQDDDIESETEVEQITEANVKSGTKAEIKIEELSDGNTKSETQKVEPKDDSDKEADDELKTENVEKETSIEHETKAENKGSEESKTPEEQKPESAESKSDLQRETKPDQKTPNETENSTPTAETTDEDDDEPESKYISDPSDITIEHIDFVQLRLAHIAKKTTSNITELRLLQAKEFEKNEIYRTGWAAALESFDDQKKKKIYKGFSTKSAVRTVADEYHIALIAYTLAFPSVYSDFNKKTREVCSGKDVDAYDYQSYFKLLLLAIEYLGSEMKFKSANKFLYRGVSSKFALEVGQILAFQHFQSTSSSLMVAEGFAGKTLFEIQGQFDTAVSIRDHSRFRHEDEVLFSPFQVYQVESKHEGKYYTRYVLIAHDLPNSRACDLDLRSAAPQQLRLENKNGALLKRSSNDADYASSSNRIIKMANSAFGLLSICTILISFVL